MQTVGIVIAAAVLLVSLATPCGMSGSDAGVLFEPAVLYWAFENPSNLRPPRTSFDPLIRRLASRNNLDWRLVLAIIETESHFREQAVSPKGAKGLMQLMPVVARTHGVVAPFEREENLSAGIRHFAWLQRKIKGRTPADALKLSLAAYNSGIGHLRDAQNLAIAKGKKPRAWKNVRPMYLLLEEKDAQANAKHGYCKGSETVDYVAKVLRRYEKYRNRYPAHSIVLTRSDSKPKNPKA